MNIYHNPNNDDECDNSIASQNSEVHQNMSSLGNVTEVLSDTSASINFKNGNHVSSHSVINIGEIGPSQMNAEAILCSSNSSASNTCSYDLTSTTIASATPTLSSASLSSPSLSLCFHQTQKWRDRPRGQLQKRTNKSKPVIWNLFNFVQLHSHKQQQKYTHTLKQLCKYYLLMLVIIPSVVAVPDQHQQEPHHLNSALPLNEVKLTNTSNATASHSYTSPSSVNKTLTPTTTKFSQNVNISRNYISGSNSNNNNNEDMYFATNNLNDTNAAVKIILNDYSDAFTKIISNENEQQQLEDAANSFTYLPRQHHDDLLESFRGTHSLPRRPMYTNEFALHIPAGPDMADIIADKYGFTNMGQIGALKDYYLFHHKRISKRSLRSSNEHHTALTSEPEVRWLQQQHEKIRHKRDGSYSGLPGYSPYDIIRQTTGFGNLPTLRVMNDPETSYASTLPRAPRIQYRDAGPHNIFPDPLFKEQWYLNGGAKDGLDMNIGPAWQKGYTGKGVVVSILDDGIQKNHPDLAQNYIPEVFVLHWDGKLLPEVKGKEKSERLALVVTGKNVEKLLGIPKMQDSSGESIADTIFNLLIKWKMDNLVEIISFDTTASNTGINKGAAYLLEKKLKRDLLFLPCRHHISELLIRAVFELNFGKTAAPEVLIFNRFSKFWPNINQNNFKSGISDEDVEKLFTVGELEYHKIFCLEALKSQYVRADYKEVLQISLLFIGEKAPGFSGFRAPGATTHARFMSKNIYCFKVFLFREQFKLTTAELNSLRNICVFLTRIYVPYWFGCVKSVNAPRLDLQLINDVTAYYDTNISIILLKKIINHLWYLSEEAVALSFFDDQIPYDIKLKMVNALGNNEELYEEDISKKIKTTIEDVRAYTEKNLSDFVSAKTKRFFTRLQIDCSFLHSDPVTWKDRDDFCAGKIICENLAVVNDAAERGVKLITDFNRALTYDEEDKQYLLQVVEHYRKIHPSHTKSSLVNQDPDASFDINGNDSDPSPQDNGDNKHGTRCAGEVAAVAFNNYCGVGVAYNASIGGVRMLDGKVNDVVEAQALSLNPSHIDIYSASWGPEDDGSTVDGPGPLARRAFIYGVTSGRQGKGSIFVWASGNGGRYTDSCNCDGYTNSIFTLSISSATQGGFKPWYLEECSSTLATTYSSGTPGHDKSVATVDMDGRLRLDHICTVEHTGTSASAPLAAGICALALEANPNLTWRDMQYLVVYTSRPSPLEKEAGWMLNGVKRKYSHKFGYGLMDAGAMVSLAEQWTTVPPQHICKSRENNEDRKIEGTYGYTLATHMDVNGCAGTINEVRYLEHVQCRITLRFFPRGNLRILLTSPMGTTSTLLFERPRDIVKSNFDDWPFLSVHFWGEKAEGRWTLQIINGGRRRVNQPGILSKWQLIFYGTAVQPMRLKSDLVSSSLRDPGYTFPTESDLGQPLNTDQFSSFLNFQNLYTGAGSNPEQTVTTVDGHNIPTPQRQNVMADSNNKLVLHDCDPECDSQGCYGRGPTQCVACKHYRLDNTCVSRCPPRSFPNQGGVCWPCHESCETCAGAGQDSCLTCAPAHLHVTDLAVCLQVCPEGYYENYGNDTCVPCEANCGSCQDRPDYCTSCEHHLVMHEHKCFSSCPLHTYETEEYTCASCHSSCATCNGSAESQCITCRSGRFAHDGKCLNSCPDGYYADKKRQECVACPTGCATCTSNGFCLTCQANWTRNKKGKCIITGSENCDESEYYDNSHCHPCHSTCESCDGPTESNCLSCPQSLLLQNNHCVSTCDDGYYMEAGVCAKCLHTCTQCVSRMNCTVCAKGLQLQSGECRTTCADGYYSDRGTCAKCYLSCQTCSGPRRDQCVQCPIGWQLAGGECHPECPEGFYKSEFGCQKCHHYCKTCNGAGPLACTSCPAHFMLDGGLCMECLGSQYYDSPTQTCKTCHESCRSCTGPGQYSCQTCAFPLHLDRLNNQCVPCCANDASPEDQSCCHCDKDTGGCINASPAGKRRIAAAAEQQQFGSSYGNNGGLYGNLLDDSDGTKDASGLFSRVGSPFTTITAIAVAACLLIVTVFAVIFAVLQRSSNNPARRTIRYNKIPTNNRRRNRITSSSTLLKVDAEANLEDEIDDEDEEDEEEDIYEREINTQSAQEEEIENLTEIDELELQFDKNSKLKMARKHKSLSNKEQQQQQQELKTFVRIPLKKPPTSSASTSSDVKTQRT